METKKYLYLKETKAALRFLRGSAAYKDSANIEFMFDEFESSLIEAVRARVAIEAGDFRQSTGYYVRRAEALAYKNAMIICATNDENIDCDRLKASLVKIIDQTLVNSIFVW